jgi:hypothetical protein
MIERIDASIPVFLDRIVMWWLQLSLVVEKAGNGLQRYPDILERETQEMSLLIDDGCASFSGR